MFLANLAALAKLAPALASRLGTAKYTLTGVSIETAKDGQPYYRSDTHGPLESDEAPAAEAEREIASIIIHPAVVAKGLGMAHHLDALQRRPDVERVFVVEPHLIFLLALLHHRDVTHLFEDKRFRWFFGPDVETVVKGIAADYDYGTDAGRSMIVMPPMNIIDHPIIRIDQTKLWDRQFTEAFDAQALTSARNRSTIAHFAAAWRGNILANLQHVNGSSPVSALFDQVKRPWIVVGAGPSLDRNVAALRTVRGRAVICCVDTAYRALRENGVRPDLVVALDAGAANLRDFDGYGRIEDSALVAVPVVRPEIMELFPRRYLAAYGHPLQRQIMTALGVEFGNLMVSGSVLTSAIDLARAGGATRIILVGCDLAAGENGTGRRASHTQWAQGICAYEGRDILDDQDATNWRSASAWGRGETKIHRRMWGVQDWLRTSMAKLGTVINASEGGIHVHGAADVPLDQALAELGESPAGPLPYEPISATLDPDLVDVDRALSWDRLVESEDGIKSAAASIRYSLSPGEN